MQEPWVNMTRIYIIVHDGLFSIRHNVSGRYDMTSILGFIFQLTRCILLEFQHHENDLLAHRIL
jgi:hypothetical protein